MLDLPEVKASQLTNKQRWHPSSRMHPFKAKCYESKTFQKCSQPYKSTSCIADGDEMRWNTEDHDTTKTSTLQPTPEIHNGLQMASVWKLGVNLKPSESVKSGPGDQTHNLALVKQALVPLS